MAPARRRFLVVSFVTAAAAVAVTSMAWACTPPASGSQTTISRSSGLGGTSITAKATGAPVLNKGYHLKFADSMALRAEPIDACPHGVTIGGPTQSTATGKIPLTSGVIPTTAAPGNGQVCFALKLDNTKWTAPAVFNVAIV